MQEPRSIPTPLADSGPSDARRQLLEKLLRGEVRQKAPAQLKLAPRASGSTPQLSFVQERLWFLDQLNPGSAVFNVPLAVRVSGPIDTAALERSINEIVRRHEALRTTFTTLNGQPLSVVAPQLDVDLKVIDQTDEAKAKSILNDEAHEPFDLGHGPLIRAMLVRLSEGDCFFLVVMHHIVSDGWSLEIFFQELTTIYGALTQGEESPLPDLAIQYADYAAWQREWLQGGLLQKQLAYWKGKLGGELPVLELPTDRPRPTVQTFSGARHWLSLNEDLTAALNALAQREGATLFITLLAAFKALLHRYTGHEDIIVGSPIANRPQKETEELIGFFLNNLALRSDLSGNPTFRDLIGRVKTTALEAYANQDVPFEKLIEALKPERDLSRTPIFQVYFNLFNFGTGITLPGSDETVSFVEAWAKSEEDLSKFDLTMYAGPQGGEFRLALVYNTDLFHADSMRRLLAHFQTLLEIVAADPNARLADLALETEVKRLRPANAFTVFTKREIEQSIADRFAKQVQAFPRRVAVKTRNHEYTYEELDRASARIAQSILGRRGATSERIALLFEHDAPMIAAMLGALKAGKTYVPLDPHHPRERLSQIIEHSEAVALLTNNRNISLAKKLARDDVHVINIDDSDPAEISIELPAIEPDRLAYILYTSGSTGQPKGVMQNHRNVLHYISVYTNNLHINSGDRLTLFSSYCFDASVMDIYGALLNGATLYPIDIREDGMANLPQELNAAGITIYHSTPTVYRYFTSATEERGAAVPPGETLSHIRLVVLGGEEVTRADVELYQKHFPHDCLFVNGLGPTEATVSLQNFINKDTKLNGHGVPVGFPVDETEVLLLDADGRSATVGEIAIKSAHVAPGYWRNPQATDAVFRDAGENIRIYRTGDMGRRLPDGSIKFEGRKDHQVKIRGYRIELGEIESALTKHSLVKDAIVVAQSNGHGDKRLIAYVVPKENASINGELRDYLKSTLPDYMVPNAIVNLDSLPMTASGKVNRRALPALESSENTSAANFAPPGTPIETVLAGIWSDLLSVAQIGINDNFFELGGHSLLAVRLFAAIERRFGKRLPLATLFNAPTVAQLAGMLQSDRAEAWSSLVPIQPNGTRPAFFCVHALGGNVLEYRDLASYLGPDQPLYGLQSQGLDGTRIAHTRLEEMAAHYLREIRELQPSGPYLIGGRSLGGMIAFEMAHQLRAQGEEIGLLALLDTYPSGYAKLLRNENTTRARMAHEMGRVKTHARNLRTLSLGDKLKYVIKKLRFAPRKIKSQVWRRINNAYEKFGRPLPRALRDVKEFNSLAVRNYVPQVYPGAVTLFWASEDLRTSIDLVEGWRALAGGGMKVHEIPGTHLDIIKEPHVQELAKILGACLSQAQNQR